MCYFGFFADIFLEISHSISRRVRDSLEQGGEAYEEYYGSNV